MVNNTICWHCQNAIPSRDGERGCSWSRSLIPVEGWKATQTVHLYDRKEKTSYVVEECPEYIRDDPREGCYCEQAN